MHFVHVVQLNHQQCKTAYYSCSSKNDFTAALSILLG